MRLQSIFRCCEDSVSEAEGIFQLGIARADDEVIEHCDVPAVFEDELVLIDNVEYPIGEDESDPPALPDNLASYASPYEEDAPLSAIHLESSVDEEERQGYLAVQALVASSDLPETENIGL